MNMRYAIILTTVLALAAPVVVAESGPLEIVRETTNAIFDRIDSERDRLEKDPVALEKMVRDLMRPTIDAEYSGRLVLGRAGRNLETEQVREFSDALTALLIERYAENLLEFKTRDQVKILELAGDNSDRMTKVKTQVTLNSGTTAPVDYVFRKTDEGWKIFDVIVEGISYVATFRNQIGEEVRRDGFDATLTRLKRGEIEIEADTNDA